MSGKNLDELVICIREVAPELAPERIRAIALRLQHDIGGSYLCKAPADGKQLRLGQALAAGSPLAQAFAQAEVSRATGYRLLRRKR